MALKMRLSRAGAKKRPVYRIVVADSRSPRDGRYIEKIGSYNPLLPKDHAERVVFDTERVQHWLSVGATPTDRVHRFLDAADMLKRAPRENPQKAQYGKKRLEREEARRLADEEAKKAAEEAAAAPASEGGEEAEAEQAAQ